MDEGWGCFSNTFKIPEPFKLLFFSLGDPTVLSFCLSDPQTKAAPSMVPEQSVLEAGGGQLVAWNPSWSPRVDASVASQGALRNGILQGAELYVVGLDIFLCLKTQILSKMHTPGSHIFLPNSTNIS